MWAIWACEVEWHNVWCACDALGLTPKSDWTAAEWLRCH